jgi:hypothetical protein
MNSEILNDVTAWDSRPFTGGYAGLRDLADRGFTGAVSEGVAWAFVLNGRVVGVFDGTIEDFEGADGTCYEAPDPSLPLLYAMRETGGETRGRYYTNDTPLSDVDQTLSAGNFTGYVELSENVLSGDYYVVYHGGKSMSVAFVGSSGRLVTGDEAFERADDEVGIYEVKPVPVDVVDIPDDETGDDGAPVDAESGAGGGASAAGVSFDDADDADDAAAGRDDGPADDAGTNETPQGEPADGPTADTERPGGDETATDEGPADDGTAADSGVADGPADDGPAADTSPDPDATVGGASTGPEPTDAGDVTDTSDLTDTSDPTDTDESEGGSDATNGGVDDASSADEEAPGDDAARGGETDAENGPSGSDGDTDLDPETVSALADEVVPGAAGVGTSATADESDVFSAESEWQEVRTIPALDPESSLPAEAEPEENAAGRTTDRAGSGRASTTRSSRETETPTDDRGRDTTGSADRVAALEEEVAEAERARAAAEEARERVAAEVEAVTDERDALREEVASLESEVADLRETVSRLEADLEAARADRPDPDRSLSPAEALDGTNLFVRYDSKSDPTLSAAAAGEAPSEAVNANLRLEHHTSFETEDVTVDGQPYEAFLHGSVEYGFTRWVVQELLYEIRDTGHETELEDLYEAIPRIDRAELHGTVSVRYVENGEEHREQERFDVVLRDRMGNPLLVANLNDSREAATEAMMRDLVQSAKRLAETSDTLGAAFLVTASFFEPAALETASEATSGGLLSRSKRASFVKLSRKQGFHLCLVETRNDDFHLNVPEL